MNQVIYVLILFFLLSCNNFEKVGGDFVRQNITRISFYFDGKIYFSTLEGYNRKFLDNEKYLIYEYDLYSKKTKKFLINGSAEGRNYVYNGKNFYISSSLSPSIIKFDPLEKRFLNLFSGESYGMWIHQLAIKNNFIYFNYSFPKKNHFKNKKFSN